MLFLPLLGFSQIYGKETYVLDSLQTFSAKKKIYEFNLDCPSQGLYLGQLSGDSIPQIEIKVINNTGHKVVNYYRERDCAVSWLRTNGRTDTLFPGQFMLLRAGWLRKVGRINCLINFRYAFFNGEDANCSIYVWGEFTPAQNKNIVAKDSISNTIIIHSKPVVEKNYVQIEKAQTLAQRPAGAAWFGTGNIHNYDSTKRDYEFRIANNKLHNSAKPRGVNDIFVWDTLTTQKCEKEYVFSFKNDSKFPLFILDVEASSANFMVQHIGKKLLLPDSVTKIKFQPNINAAGNFYGFISIHYQREGKKEYYDMGMSGFQPQNNYTFRTNQSQNRSDSIAIYIYDKNNLTLGNLTLKIKDKDSVYLPKFNKVNGEFVAFITLKYGDKFCCEIRTKENLALAKGFLTREIGISNKFLSINGNREKLHTYASYAGPINYKTLDGVYMVNWKNEFKRDEILAYLSSKGFKTQNSCNDYVTISEKSKAIALQSEIIKSKFQIVLLPIINHSHVNEFGWGGGCNYYDNRFSIEFHENVKVERIKSIFNNCAITDFKNLGINENGLIEYEFSIKTIVDQKFITTLDKLWDLPEVYSIGQQSLSVGGLD